MAGKHTMTQIVAIALLAAQLLVPVIAVPVFKVNLDLPAEQRFVEIAKHYKAEILAMQQQLVPVFEKNLGKDGRKSWLAVMDKIFDSDQTSELEGIAKTVPGTTTDQFKLMNLLYELASPTACSSVLWASANGTVMQGRNMDYAYHFKMPDGTVKNWNDVTHDVIFYKDKKPLFRTTSWPGVVGVHTGMHYGGWSFQQNTRAGNEWHDNLEAVTKGGKSYMMHVRKLMETTNDWKTVVDNLHNEKFMAPMYFIVTGAGPYEGASMTIDRLGQHLPSSPAVQNLSNTGESWHLVQTNDDVGGVPLDPRRPLANALMKGMTQDIVNETNLMKFMHTPMLLNPLTVFSTVMVPATGYYKTELPLELPSAQDGMAAAKQHWGTLPKLSADKLQKRKGIFDMIGKLNAGGSFGAEDIGHLTAFLAPEKKEKKVNLHSGQASRAKVIEKSAGQGQHPFSFLLAIICVSCLRNRFAM